MRDAERTMHGMKLLSAALVAGLAVWGASARAGSSCANTPPAVAFSTGSYNGLPALLCDITDADGAADLLGQGYTWIMSDGKAYPNLLQLTLVLNAKKKIATSTLPNGKRIAFTQLPGDLREVRVTATDKRFQMTTASATVPPEVSAGQPPFVKKK